jgi:hypothetical protein
MRRNERNPFIVIPPRAYPSQPRYGLAEAHLGPAAIPKHGPKAGTSQ